MFDSVAYNATSSLLSYIYDALLNVYRYEALVILNLRYLIMLLNSLASKYIVLVISKQIKSNKLL